MPESQTENNQLIGKTIGGYRIEAILGRGGMGTVYKAVQVSLDRIVALKILAPHLVADRNFVEQFFREARAAANLNHHNVVHVYDVGNEGETYFYSMELMEGGTVEAKIRRDGKIPLKEAAAMIRDAARGLEYAESKKIVHRDIKPENLMMGSHGIVKIADLGLAAGHQTIDSTGRVFGTPHFISPEQARREAVDSRSDIYSLGASFYRMLTGKTVFSGKTVKEILLKQLQETPAPPRELNPEIPEEIEAMILQCLQKEPAKRFQSAREVGDLLDAFLSRQSTSKLRLALFAGLPLLLVAGILLWAEPWRESTPQIIEKIVEKGPDPSQLAASEQMKQDLREKDALIAYRGIGEELSHAEREQALLKLAKDFADTTFAKQLQQEATTLREKIQNQERLDQENAAKIATLQTELQNTVDSYLENRQFALAAKAVMANAEVGLSELRNRLIEKIQNAEQTSVQSFLDTANRFIQEGKWKEAGEEFARAKNTITPLEGIPETLANSFRADLEKLEAASQELFTRETQHLEEQEKSDRLLIYQNLFENFSLAKELGELQFAKAKQSIQNLRTQLVTTGHQTLLTRLESDVAELNALLDILIAQIQAQTLNEKNLKNPGTGKPYAIASASREQGITLQELQRKDRNLTVPWNRFDSVQLLHELFADRWNQNPEQNLSIAKLMLLCGLAQETPNVVKNLLALRTDRASEMAKGFSEEPFSLANEFLKKASAKGLDSEKQKAAAEWIGKEQNAAKLFNQALKAFRTKDFDSALPMLERLQRDYSDSLVFIFLSDGTSSWVTKAK